MDLGRRAGLPGANGVRFDGGQLVGFVAGRDSDVLHQQHDGWGGGIQPELLSNFAVAAGSGCAEAGHFFTRPGTAGGGRPALIFEHQACEDAPMQVLSRTTVERENVAESEPRLDLPDGFQIETEARVAED